jgi:hypothetical protein
MASVSITATQEGTYSTPDGNRAAILRISYAGDVNVRAFALDISIDSNCNFWNIRDFNAGENKGVAATNGYGIFPGRFRAFVNAATPDACYANHTNYNPLVNWADPGQSGTGIGYGAIIAEMGYLGAGDINKPALSGTLFRIDVNGYAFQGTAHLTIAADTMRGGVVSKDTNATTTATNLPAVFDVCFPFISTCDNIPNILTPPLTKAAADAAIIAAGLTPNGTGSVACSGTYGYVISQDPISCVAPGTTVNYTYETGKTVTNEVGATPAVACPVWVAQGFVCGTGTPVVDCAHLGVIISHDTGCKAQGTAINYTYGVAPTEPNVVGMTRAAARAALIAAGFTVGTDVNGWGGNGVTTVGYVYAQSPAAGTVACNQTVNCSVVSYPIKDTAVTNSIYANWVTMGKPQCWAYPRQCHGDADGKKLGNFWVSGNDLTILKSGISKLQTAIPAGGICASFSHKKLGNFWVSGNDLIILKAYISKLESLVPVCGTPGVSDPNFWYFCVPTGATCPTGVTCATVGVCPNTP